MVKMKYLYPMRSIYESMDLDEFKRSGRKNIIQIAVEKMKAQYPHFILEDEKQVRIFASNRTVRVILGIAIFSGPTREIKWIQKANYETVFRKDMVICFPFNPREDFILDDKDKELITIALHGRSLSFDEGFSIVDRGDYYDVGIFYNLTGEYKGYKVDKNNGNWDLKYHQPPQIRPKGSLPHVDLGIEDSEIFNEIKD
jgi:hypothetical protein